MTLESIVPVGAATAPQSTGAANQARIAEMLFQLARVTEASNPGVTRLGFTQRERDAHELVSGWLTEVGARVWRDSMGNTFGEYPGDPGLAAIGVGSHLDTVPQGGSFDGAVGIAGGLELLYLLRESNEKIRHPVRIVAFACEEGARFGQACIGSRAVVGEMSAPAAENIRDPDGISLAEAMRDLELNPGSISAAQWEPNDWAAFLELHIEQGSVLESDGTRIGIVDIVSGSTRLRVDLHGRADHSGGTPMGQRADALAAAAELVLMGEAMALRPQNRGVRITVGRLVVQPNSLTTIPGEVTLTVDVRDVDPDRQRDVARRFVREGSQACMRRNVGVDFSVIGDLSPAVMPVFLREVLIDSCRAKAVRYRVMTSGASHDAQVVNRKVPAAVLFVPSRGGLSHVPEEWSSSLDIALAVDVLHATVLRLDQELQD